MALREAIAGLLLVRVLWEDVRRHRVPNEAVLVAAMVGCVLGWADGGWAGLGAALVGGAAGFLWWPAVHRLRLGVGDLKLLVALGTLLGPGVAVMAPAWGAVACALWLLPGLRAPGVALGRHREIPFSPWIALGAGLTLLLRGRGL